MHGFVAAAAVRGRVAFLLAAHVEEVFALDGFAEGDGDGGVGHGV